MYNLRVKNDDRHNVILLHYKLYLLLQLIITHTHIKHLISKKLLHIFKAIFFCLFSTKVLNIILVFTTYFLPFNVAKYNWGSFEIFEVSL
jgi:hypothetical protein